MSFSVSANSANVGDDVFLFRASANAIEKIVIAMRILVPTVEGRVKDKKFEAEDHRAAPKETSAFAVVPDALFALFFVVNVSGRLADEISRV